MVYFVFAILIVLCIVSLIRGFRITAILKMTLPGIKRAFIVVQILLLIGMLTGLWRSSGTISYFVSFGIHILPPTFFVLSAFLLTALMSLAIGTSFGVAATAGVILMSIARAGDIMLIPVAGAIMSGICVGDRNSLAASSASLVATVTGTQLNRNLKIMFRTSLIPLLLCLALYTGLSLMNPMKSFNTDALLLIENEFNLHWVCLIPALLMVILPLCRVKVKLAMMIDIVLSFLIAIFVQGESVIDTLKVAFFGYEAAAEALEPMLNGGGILSMATVSIILLVSGSFSEIIHQTGLFEKVYVRIEQLNTRIGRFATVLLLSIVCCMVFCNQTISIMMVNQLTSKLYHPENEKYRKMSDMEDSTVLLGTLIPWCLACSVPLATLGVSELALPFSFFIWILPLYRLIRGKAISDKITG